MRTNRFVTQLFVLLAITAFVLSACAPAAPDVAKGYTGVVVKGVPQDLVTACKAEGMLTIIATPPDWANYGEIFADFQNTSGVKINSLNPNAGSGDEIAAIEANKNNKGPQAPDIVDVGYAFGKSGKDAGDYQAYKVSTWDKIPDTILGLPAKDPDGFWTGGYYGVMAFASNNSVVKNPPKNWSDLLKPWIHRPRLEPQRSKGGISRLAPRKLAPPLHSLPPILHILHQDPMPSYSKGSRGLSV